MREKTKNQNAVGLYGHGEILLNAPKGSEQISSEPFGAIKYNVSKPS